VATPTRRAVVWTLGPLTLGVLGVVIVLAYLSVAHEPECLLAPPTHKEFVLAPDLAARATGSLTFTYCRDDECVDARPERRIDVSDGTRAELVDFPPADFNRLTGIIGPPSAYRLVIDDDAGRPILDVPFEETTAKDGCSPETRYAVAGDGSVSALRGTRVVR
jgi:hypothetical protein